MQVDSNSNNSWNRTPSWNQSWPSINLLMTSPLFRRSRCKRRKNPSKRPSRRVDSERKWNSAKTECRLRLHWMGSQLPTSVTRRLKDARKASIPCPHLRRQTLAIFSSISHSLALPLMPSQLSGACRTVSEARLTRNVGGPLTIRKRFRMWLRWREILSYLKGTIATDLYSCWAESLTPCIQLRPTLPKT